MAYFSRTQDGVERGCKIAADIVCALLLAAFSIAFFGAVGGILAFAITEAALLAVDWLVPGDDDVSGAALR